MDDYASVKLVIAYGMVSASCLKKAYSLADVVWTTLINTPPTFFSQPLKKSFIHLFIYGSTGGLHCCVGFFSSCGKWGLLSTCGAQISHCSGLSYCSRTRGVGCVGFSSWMFPFVYPATAVWSNHLAEDLGWISGSGRSPGGGMATHSSILAWRIPWTEEAGGLQSMGLQKVRHDWATKHVMRRKEDDGRGKLWTRCQD